MTNGEFYTVMRELEKALAVSNNTKTTPADIVSSLRMVAELAARLADGIEQQHTERG